MTARPRVSVITPSHAPAFLDAAYGSLRRQTLAEWEWIVLLNNGAEWSATDDDERVRVHRVGHVSGVGEAKRLAAAYATTGILVELDHDDLLAPDALEQTVAAFEAHPGASVVYSHAAAIDASGQPTLPVYDAQMGWRYGEAEIDGVRYPYPISFPPTPHNVSYIWFAPNHLRAFDRELYERVGGHDPALGVADDHDLLCRLYQAGPFVLVDECLYLQRLHDGNTHRVPELNAEIQLRTVELYDRHFEANALAWAAREGLMCLDLGAAHGRPPSYTGVDSRPGADVDIVATLPDPLRLADGAVGVIRAVDFLEHVADKVATMNEIHRLLAPGGALVSQTPSSDGRGAFQDPTHVAFYNENSFWYWTDDDYRRYVPEIEARFQVSRLRTHFPSEWHRSVAIPYVGADLLALKPGSPANGGPVRIAGFR